MGETILALAKILGTKRTEELKDYILEKLKDEVDESFRENWCLDEALVSDAMEEIYAECLKAAKERIIKRLTDKIETKILSGIELKGELK